MVGNDVVDLADPQCQPMGTHPRFDGRVFVPSELGMIRTSSTPMRTRWMLWAAKESAYKVARKLEPATTFAPARFVVQLDRPQPGAERHAVSDLRAAAPVRGSVTCALHRVRFRVVAEGEALHVVATCDDRWQLHLLTAVAETGAAAPSAAARCAAVDAIAARLGVAADELCILRHGRIPRLHLRGRLLPIDLSLSHHGRFVAFAALMPFPGGAV